jgi:hypothetical protein
MMLADSLRFVVPSGVSLRWPSPCCRACSANASAPHLAQHPALSFYVQASCLERARPKTVAAFAGGLAGSSTAPPGRRRLERKRQAKAEGKIKGRGTWPLENPVCTRGGAARAKRRQRAARVRNAASALAKTRASPAGLRRPWMELPDESQR